MGKNILSIAIWVPIGDLKLKVLSEKSIPTDNFRMIFQTQLKLGKFLIGFEPTTDISDRFEF